MRGLRRSILSAILFLFITIVFVPLPVLADNAVVSVQPPVSNPGVGSSFDVFVNISSVKDLYAFQFDVGFNPSVISALTVTEGAFLPNGGTTSFIPGSIDNIGGLITNNADILLGSIPGVSGDGPLLEISFQALTAGVSLISLSNIILLDSNSDDIPFTSTDGTVRTVDQAQVPEPSTILFLGSGLVGLIGFRKKIAK